MRLLITGSRTWDDPTPIRHGIHQELWTVAENLGGLLTVVHGAAKGADMLAGAYAREMRLLGAAITEEPHPADWRGPCPPECPDGHRRRKPKNSYRRHDTYCPTAGHRRNAHMVNLGADLCIAFIRDNSAGATACARLAQAAGIPTTVVRWEDRETYLQRSNHAV